MSIAAALPRLPWLLPLWVLVLTLCGIVGPEDASAAPAFERWTQGHPEALQPTATASRRSFWPGQDEKRPIWDILQGSDCDYGNCEPGGRHGAPLPVGLPLEWDGLLRWMEGGILDLALDLFGPSEAPAP